ncbi:MAG: NAD(+)/NADH kinase [Oscillospiraceae bacterium]|nr:NAD(+)/NADH kinase [Oscillospiraceae bacterium]
MKFAIVANPLLENAVLLRREVSGRLESLGLELTADVSVCDIIVTIGGDGTVLRHAVKGKPILGIHAGTVGFLTEIDKTELNLLEKLANGGYRIENRLLIYAAAKHFTATALNEITVSAAPDTRGRHCVKISAFAGESEFAVYRGDGLIFSTPTGSTGYSLSAGGCVFDPAIEAILLTPLYSHNLGAKPLVFSPQQRLRIVSRETLSVSVDGGELYSLPAGQELVVTRADDDARFVRLHDMPFAARLDKLR